MSKVYYRFDTPSEAISQTIKNNVPRTQGVATCNIEGACEMILAMAARDVLPQLAQEMPANEDESQFRYIYKGIGFRVTIERDRWDIHGKVELALDMGE